MNWAAGVARLESIDMLRKIQREQSRCTMDNLDDIRSMEVAQEDKALREILERELSEETEELLSCLCEKDRELFERIFIEQAEPEEVGDSMGMSRDNVYVRLWRGKRKMRKKAAQWKGARIV